MCKIKKYWNCFVQKGKFVELQLIVGVVFSKHEGPSQPDGRLSRYGCRLTDWAYLKVVLHSIVEYKIAPLDHLNTSTVSVQDFRLINFCTVICMSPTSYGIILNATRHFSLSSLITKKSCWKWKVEPSTIPYIAEAWNLNLSWKEFFCWGMKILPSTQIFFYLAEC